MSPKGSHWSPEEAKPRVRPQADQSAAPRLHGGERQLGTQGSKKRPWSRGRQGRWFPKQQGSGQNLPGADHLRASPLKVAVLSSPCSVALEADPTGLDQRGPVCFLLTSPRGIYSLAPSLGHLGQAVRSAESSGRSFLEILTSRF